VGGIGAPHAGLAKGADTLSIEGDVPRVFASSRARTLLARVNFACQPRGMGEHPSGPVPDDAAATHWLGGISARLMLPASATSDRFAVIEHRLRPRELVAPLHRHSREDEYTIVTEGTVGFLLGDQVATAGVGALVRKPRNQWHTFFNAGDTEAKVLEVISPAGFERYFDELVAFFPLDGEPDLEGMVEANTRYGIDMDFDSLPDIVRRFDLADPAELEAPEPPG
jgi:quercetin dioxygenase-like cupin family protein